MSDYQGVERYEWHPGGMDESATGGWVARKDYERDTDAYAVLLAERDHIIEALDAKTNDSKEAEIKQLKTEIVTLQDAMTDAKEIIEGVL